jgi:hypothetical protein
MMGDNAVQFRPQPINVRGAQAFDPLAALRHAFGSAFRAGCLRLRTRWRQLSFFFDFVT